MNDKPKFSLKQIAEYSKIVIIDSCINHWGDSISQQIYDCHEMLFLDQENIEQNINNLVFLIKCVSNYSNIFTIKQVKDEINEHLDIINGQYKFHKQNLQSRRFNGIGIKQRRYKTREYQRNVSLIRRKIQRYSRKKSSRRFKYSETEKDEEGLVDYLKLYSDKLHELIKIFDDSRLIRIVDKELLDAVKKEAKEKDLKKSFDFRHGSKKSKFKKYRRDNYTDEMLIVAAYTFAHKGNLDVSVLSNDSDLDRIFRSCFDSGIFEVLSKNCIRLYSNFEQDNKGYKLEFDSSRLR